MEGSFSRICGALPSVLRPLGEVLVAMKKLLTRAYASFEDSFDGSRMLLVFSELRKGLLFLENRAQSLTVESPIQNRKLNTERVEQFDAITLREEQGWWGGQVVEHKERVGGQLTSIDDPIDAEKEDSTLGKRRADLPSKEDRVLKPRTNTR